MDSYSSGSLDSDSESSVGHGGLSDEQIESTIRLLIQVLETTPNDYQSRIQLIGLLRQQGDIDDLISQRETLSAMFPLSEEVWLEWLEDEERIASQESEKLTLSQFKHIDHLYQRASNDYLSVNIYLRWLTFMEKVMVDSMEAQSTNSSSINDFPNISIEDVRKHYEMVLEKTCHHLSQAGEVWRRYHQFEDLIAACIDETDSSSILDSIHRKRLLFHRELSKPHSQLEDVFLNIYVPWEAQIGELKSPLSENEKQAVQQKYEESWKEFTYRKSFEESLSEIEENYHEKHTPDYTKLEIIRKYVSFEETRQKLSSGRIICLYERALSMYFLVLDLWESYSMFLLTSAKLHSKAIAIEAAINVQKRAVRNYPYSHHMWCQLILTLERRLFYPFQDDKKDDHSEEDENEMEQDETKNEASIKQKTSKATLAQHEYIQTQITEVFEKSLVAGLQSGAELVLVYKQYLDYRIRAVRDWKDASQVSPILNLFESARTYFNNFLPDHSFDIEEYWANIALVKLNNPEKARECFEAAARINTKNSRLWISYIQFEIQVGHPEKARSLYKRAVASDVDFPETIWNAWKDFERIYGDAESFMVALQRCSKKQREANLKAAAALEASLAQVDESLPFKEKNKRNAKGSRIGGKNGPESKKKIKDEEGDAIEVEKTNQALEATKQRLPQNRANRNLPNFDPLTMHVAGLPASESLDNNVIAQLFKPFGEISEVRFPRNKMGLLKGFAFVQLKNTEQSQAIRTALKKGNHKFVLNWEGVPYQLRVSPAVALKPAKEKDSKAKEEALHTVFLSNLSFTTTEASIENFIRSIKGDIPTSIRVPKDRKTGANRGMAYLDYESAEAVQKAVETLRDTMIDGRKVKAAPSAPTKARPAHDQQQQTYSTSLGSLGGQAAQDAEKKAAASGNVPRLIPRSIAMKNSQKMRVAIPKQPQQHEKMETD